MQARRPPVGMGKRYAGKGNRGNKQPHAGTEGTRTEQPHTAQVSIRPASSALHRPRSTGGVPLSRVFERQPAKRAARGSAASERARKGTVRQPTPFPLLLLPPCIVSLALPAASLFVGFRRLASPCPPPRSSLPLSLSLSLSSLPLRLAQPSPRRLSGPSEPPAAPPTQRPGTKQAPKERHCAPLLCRVCGRVLRCGVSNVRLAGADGARRSHEPQPQRREGKRADRHGTTGDRGNKHRQHTDAEQTGANNAHSYLSHTVCARRCASRIGVSLCLTVHAPAPLFRPLRSGATVTASIRDTGANTGANHRRRIRSNGQEVYERGPNFCCSR
jgi:hypothetical protein